MARTPQEIMAEAEARHNPKTQGNGQLLRTDVAEFLSSIGQEPIETKRQELANWLKSGAFLTEKDRAKIVSDIESYDS